MKKQYIRVKQDRSYIKIIFLFNSRENGYKNQTFVNDTENFQRKICNVSHVANRRIVGTPVNLIEPKFF